METLGWRACGNNSLQVLAAIWKLWCRKKNRVTSLSSKWAFLLPRASVVLTLFNTSSLTQNERLVHAAFQANRRTTSLPEWSRYMCLISTFFSTITVKVASVFLVCFFFIWTAQFSWQSWHFCNASFSSKMCSMHWVTLQQVNASRSTSEWAGWRPLARVALF